MSLKLRLARIAARIEAGVDGLLRQVPPKPGWIEAYDGYATPEHLVVRGRVLARSTASTVRPEQGPWRNFRAMVRLFATDEVRGVRLVARGVAGVSDEEGYFRIEVPRGSETGWVDIEVRAGELKAVCPVLVAPEAAAFMVISDIDDTMMRTGAYSLAKNIWTSLTGNAQTREVFGDAKRLVEVLHEGGRNPVYFVSSSPWNFHAFLKAVFERAGLPQAPVFLRDYGISETQFITGTHGDHKGDAIDRLMAANPGLDAVLVGDSGQHDPVVYADAAERHPGRVRTVVIRSAGGIGPEDEAEVARILGTGAQVFVGESYEAAIAAFEEALA